MAETYKQSLIPPLILRDPSENMFCWEKSMIPPQISKIEPQQYLNTALKSLELQARTKEDNQRIGQLIYFLQKYPHNIIPEYTVHAHTGVTRLQVSIGQNDDFRDTEPVFVYKPYWMKRITPEELGYELYRESVILDFYEKGLYGNRLFDTNLNAVIEQAKFINRWGKYARYRSILNPLIHSPEHIVHHMLETRLYSDFGIQDMKKLIYSFSPSEHMTLSFPISQSPGTYADLFSLWQECENDPWVFAGFREYISEYMNYNQPFTIEDTKKDIFYFLNAQQAIWTYCTKKDNQVL